MSKLKTDIEIIDFLNCHEKFESDVTVGCTEILASISNGCNIDKHLIADIESITDGNYYFVDENRVLVIPRLKESLNH